MRRACLLLVGTLACSHSEPFRPVPYTPGGPLGVGPRVQLTYNAGTDHTPAWLPDGSGLLYAFERTDRPDRDHCLGLLPPLGGTLRRSICNTAAVDDDSVDVFEWPAVSPDGRLAYVAASTMLLPFRGLAPTRQAIVLGTLIRPLDVVVVQPLGYTTPGGRTHDGISHLRWLDSTRLVFVGETVAYPQPCPGCPGRDTVRTGVELVTIDVSGPAPLLATVPGTDGASSVAVVSADTVLYTINGDSRVFRYTFSSGQSVAIHDFAPDIAREAQMAGSRLVAVVGGSIPLGGGYLHVVDLTAGTDSVLPDTSFRYRHAATAPGGARVAVEVLSGTRGDIWLLDLP